MSRIVESLEKLCESNLQSNLPTEIEIFMNMDSDTDTADQYRIAKAAGDIFFKELKDIIHKEDDWDYIDNIYTDKRNFYKKYLEFAKKCRDMSNIAGITGYGKLDPIKLKVVELCKAVNYNFPYGWK